MQFLYNELAKIKPNKNTWKHSAVKLLRLIEAQEVLFSVPFEDYDPAEYEDRQYKDWSASMAEAIATAYRPTHFTCSVCRQTLQKANDGAPYAAQIGTGYAKNNNGEKICYPCCGKQTEEELLSMNVGDRTTLYFSGNDEKGYEVTNWPGTFRRTVYPRKSQTNWRHVERFDFWFKVGENHFHGKQIGHNNEIAHVQCVKPF